MAIHSASIKASIDLDATRHVDWYFNGLLDDAVAMERTLAAGARRAVVVGACYIGLEVAEALLHRGLAVTVVERPDAPMSAVLDADMAAEDAAAMRAAGIAVGEAGGILWSMSEHQRNGTPHIWAADDCVECRHRLAGRAVVVALGTHANKPGRVAGTNIAGGHAAFDGVLGTAITRFQTVEIGRTGLTEREAATAGLDTFGVTTEASSRAGYYPDTATMNIKLVVERGAGRLLGVQIVGGAESGKRINVLATALWNQMTVAKVAGVDLAYARPFSPVWDPVLLAAGKAASRV